jgi:hypothetical protein
MVVAQDLPRVRIDDADGASHARASEAKKSGRPGLRVALGK